MSDLTVKTFFEEKMVNHLNNNQELVEDIDSTYLFNITGAGSWCVDLTQFPPVIKEDMIEADCTIGMESEDLLAIATKELDGMSAFTMGKITIDGDFGLALKLQSLLDFDE